MTPNTADAGPGLQGLPNRRGRSFLLFVLGGHYPASHPLILAPSLFSSIFGGAGSQSDEYSDLLRLAELLGQVKPSTVSQQQVDDASLETISASQMTEYVLQDKIIASTAEKVSLLTVIKGGV